MDQSKPKVCRCGIYTRKSSEEGLEQDFNSLPSVRHARRSSRARRVRTGDSSRPLIMTADYRVVPWSGPRCSSCSQISATV
jgi:hypothetical protein